VSPGRTAATSSSGSPGCWTRVHSGPTHLGRCPPATRQRSNRRRRGRHDNRQRRRRRAPAGCGAVHATRGAGQRPHAVTCTATDQSGNSGKTDFTLDARVAGVAEPSQAPVSCRTRTSVFTHQSKVVADRRLTQAQVCVSSPTVTSWLGTAIDHAEQSESGRVGIEPQRLRERFRARVRVRTCWSQWLPQAGGYLSRWVSAWSQSR
jgi:hypothetical protein